MLQIAVPNIRAVNDKHNRMAGGIVALPKLAQTMLAPYIPHLEIHIRQRNRGDILAYRRNGLELRRRVVG